MKFMMAMIYAMAAALLMGLLAAYFYFSVLQQQSPNPADETTANIALLLFVNAVLVFSLILIWLENMPDTPEQSALDKYISEVRDEERQIQQHSSSSQQIEPVLQRLNQISQALSLTNKTLNLGLERLSTRIDEVENASLDRVINADKKTDSAENYPQLSTIFNDELAETLSNLEIMQDDSKKENITKIKDVDIDKLINNIKE